LVSATHKAFVALEDSEIQFYCIFCPLFFFFEDKINPESV